MKKQILSLALVMVGLTTTVSASAKNIAVVNGKAVSSAELIKIETELKKQGQNITPEIRDRLKQELIAKEVFIQQANKLGLNKSANYIQAVQDLKQNLLVQTLFNEYLIKNPVSDVAIRADYDKTVKALGKTEYKVSHILLETEDEAKKAIKEIKKSNFKAVAKKLSKDDGSVNQGGDLGWNVPINFTPEFSNTFSKLEVGKVSDPVKTSFGWHVILIEDTRSVKIPSYQSVKDQIKDKLQQEKIFIYSNELIQNAKININ